MTLKKIVLAEEEIPRSWYNIAADMPHPVQPPLNPSTGKPLKAEDLAPVFPMNLIEQEVSTEKYIDIPDEVLEKLLIWRPTPLKRAFALEKYLQTPAKIYYKDESVSPAGSHKPNTAVAQAYYNKVFGIKRVTTETGAGQWGSALSFACSQFGLECKVYMVKISYEQKPYRRLLMQTWGGSCFPSPSNETNYGRRILAEDPSCPGSLGIAITEAVEDAVNSKNTRYTLGSVLNHVMLHQTIIGLEALKQFKQINDYPDIVIGCVGGGSNFSGLSFPFLRDKINGKQIRVIASEPTACPTLTRGGFAYDYGDTGGMTPLLAMYTLGHNFMPAKIHAGGLRYHGASPILSQLVKDKLIEARSYDQITTYQAGVLFARTEGQIPAPETCHAIAAAIQEAEQAKEEGKEKTIVFNYSGHGLLDLSGYSKYLEGGLEGYSIPDEEIEKSLKSLADLPKVSGE